MYSACRNNALLLAALLAVAGCARERREFEPPAPSTAPPAATSISPITAGGAALDTGVRDSRQQQYGDNAWHISRGKTLYGAFNCYGCHAWGGGDIGPPLMDDKWIYGGEIDQVYLSIAQGRANGMPAFGNRISSEQIWQIAAYVRSMSGNAPKASRSARDDHLRTPAPADAIPSPLSSAERED